MSGPLGGRLSPRVWKALNALGLLVLIALVLPFVTAAFPGLFGAYPGVQRTDNNEPGSGVAPGGESRSGSGGDD